MLYYAILISSIFLKISDDLERRIKVIYMQINNQKKLT